MYVYRQLEDQIKPFIKRKEVISIIGPRQAGKTTFIQQLAKKLKEQKKEVKFITFERRIDLDSFQNNLEDFRNLAKKYQYVIIDEFQYAKDGGKKLKYLYDTLDQTKFIISGSSSLELTFQTGKYMVGRMLEFKLFPFSFREFLSVKDSEAYNLLAERIDPSSFFKFNPKKGFGEVINGRLAEMLEKYVVFGGYPAVVLTRAKAEKIKILEGIIEKYLLKDIKGLLNLATEDELLRLAKFLAVQIGGLVRFEELSNISNLTYQEVIKHLNILESTYLIKLIRPFYTNKRLELAKSPKCYFFDLGIRNFLINDFRPLQVRNDLGRVMENYAQNLFSRLNFSPNLKYWRTKSKAEVDFIIEKEQNFYPIEVKYVSKRLIGRSFYSFIDKFNPAIGIILTKDFLGEEKIKNTKVKFIPLSYF